MPTTDGEYRLYRDLASWWPLISPPEEYAQEAAYLAEVLHSAATVPVREVLDLGCGGGHVAVHLKDRFALTLADISGDMLAVSRRLNPECRHLQGDMRTLRLKRTFDAVLVHDAVDYITTQNDLRQVVQTAFALCRPGGVAVFVPDYVKDTFGDLTGGGGGGTDAAGRQATFTEVTWDPNPADDWVQAEYEFTLRHADGTVDVIRETHRLGAFSRELWLRLLAESGFDPSADVGGPAMPGQRPDNLFAGVRPQLSRDTGHRPLSTTLIHMNDRRRLELRADCERCAALCCVAPAFSVSAEFAIDKAAGQPCPNLRADFRCSIHDRLRPSGFGGCAAFDCLGAGQQVVRGTFGGRDWRSEPELAAPMFAAFAVMRPLHELLWYLNEALALNPAEPLSGELDRAFSATERLTHCGPDELIAIDVDAHRREVNTVLLRVSEHVRERAGALGPDLRGADLAGKDLRQTGPNGTSPRSTGQRGTGRGGASLRGTGQGDRGRGGVSLRGASLRGALLIGADLRNADLSYADLTGADLRGARLAGADLGTTLFLAQPQLDSALGDSRTTLPPHLSRPLHWSHSSHRPPTPTR